ncbi:MAG: magnesium chelatase subunit D family protein [Candidatus Jordarchaeum sp.]|uniref:magnesium chelatase subunit D family protein n=1 Tax=Candidatus Jordarchaeum sp. TaxID=2823881 RepID=UPI004049A140
MHHKFVLFPFTAIVNQELLKKSLLVNAIDPSIGGVLIKGDKGSGKSTAVRALTDILPKIRVVMDCPFNCDPKNLRLMCKSCQERYEREGQLPWTERKMEIVDMPLSATEDMVIGTIDIKRALKEGIKALEPGLLARANKNILYIDEVNLLDDHLVNILLDAAAMGVNIVEREGISVYHPARFILIGTMNPEEGELRPQLLDRFGLCVEVNALSSKEDRLKVMEYRRDFDSDPWKFEEKFKDAQEMLKKRIANAQLNLSQINIPQNLVEKIVEITKSLGIKTHRADIVMEKTAKALSALSERDYVTEEDLKEAALLALSHRIRQKPFEKGVTPPTEVIETILQERTKEEIFDFEKDAGIKRDLLELDATSSTRGRDFPKMEGERGLYIKARESKTPKNIAIDATLRKAVRETGKLEVLPEHLMEKVRISKGEALYIILLDSSSSMGIEKKIRFAKTLTRLLLKQSYEKKNRVALLAFRGDDAEILVEPTSDYDKLIDALEKLPTGGKTPLTPALLKAFEIAKKEIKAVPTVILISDGKGNVFIKNNLEEDIKFLSTYYDGLNLVVVNAESKNRSIGVLEEIAEMFNSPHFYLEDVI